MGAGQERSVSYPTAQSLTKGTYFLERGFSCNFYTDGWTCRIVKIYFAPVRFGTPEAVNIVTEQTS